MNRKAHTKARSREEEKDSEKDSASDPLRASASPRDTPSSEPLRAFVSSCETSPIRNRLLRLTADSPDLLAVIKQEGQV